MEAEKFCMNHSVDWRTVEASGIAQSKSKDLRPLEVAGESPQVWRLENLVFSRQRLGFKCVS